MASVDKGGGDCCDVITVVGSDVTVVGSVVVVVVDTVVVGVVAEIVKQFSKYIFS